MRKSMAHLVVTAGILLAESALAGSYKLNCWDGSFAYNTVNVRESQEGYEVSLSGSTLLQNEDSGWQPMTVHTLFPRESCSLDRGALQCQLNSTAGTSAGLVLEKRTSPELMYLPVESLSFSSDQDIALSVSGSVPEVSSRGSFILGFTPYTCNNAGSTRSGGTHWGAARFNDEIREMFRNGG